MSGQPSFTIRLFEPDDLQDVLELLESSLMWSADSQHASLFRWKHELNPFGPSLMYVALSGTTLIGFRALLRWRFRSKGKLYEALRPVDTVTHPGFRRRGVFRDLTRHALREAEASSTAFLFNTPDAESAPQYAKLGWRTVRRPALWVKPGFPPSWHRMRGAWAHAEQLSVVTQMGLPAYVAFANSSNDFVDQQDRREPFVTTDDSPAFRQWRYGYKPLGYRVLRPKSGPDGCLVFRLRRRGTAVEAVLCATYGGSERRLLRWGAGAVIRETPADFATWTGSRPPIDSGFVPAVRLGPRLVWRPIAQDLPAILDWRPTLGELELL